MFVVFVVMFVMLDQTSSQSHRPQGSQFTKLSSRIGLRLLQGEHKSQALLSSDWTELLFFQESIEDLVETLFMLSSDSTQILLTYEERDSEIKLEVMKMFFEKMKTHFTWRKIPHSEHHPDFESPDIQIFKFLLLS